MNAGWWGGWMSSGVVWGRRVWVDGREDCAHNLVVNWDSFSQGGHSLRVTQCAVRSRDTQRLSFSSLNRLWRRFWVVSENYYNVTVVWQRRQRQDESSSRDENSLLSIPYKLFLRNLQHRKGGFNALRTPRNVSKRYSWKFWLSSALALIKSQRCFWGEPQMKVRSHFPRKATF